MLGRSGSDNPFSPAENPNKGLIGKLGGNNSSTAAGIRFVIRPSRQSCTVLAALTGVILIASAAVYFWQSDQINTLEALVHAKNSQLKNSQKIAGDLNSVKAENEKTRDELGFLETSVTQGEYVPTLLHQTQDLALSTNLHVNALRPQLEPAAPPPADKDAAKKTPPQPYDKLRVEMDLTGHYWDLALMLYKLTQFPKIMTVDSVDISPATTPTTSTDHSQLSVKLKLTGFIFKADTPKGGAAPATGDAAQARPASGSAVAPLRENVANPGAPPAPNTSSAPVMAQPVGVGAPGVPIYSAGSPRPGFPLPVGPVRAPMVAPGPTSTINRRP